MAPDGSNGDVTGSADGDCVRLVVDLANVMGSRPDGWWRDRAGAAQGLIAAIRGRGWSGRQWADALDLEGVVGEIAVIVEGAARRAAGAAPGPAGSAAAGAGAAGAAGADGPVPVRVLAAPGSGDDAVVSQVAGAPPGACVVITSDRGLAGRVRSEGAPTRPAGRFRSLLQEGAEPGRAAPR